MALHDTTQRRERQQRTVVCHVLSTVRYDLLTRCKVDRWVRLTPIMTYIQSDRSARNINPRRSSATTAVADVRQRCVETRKNVTGERSPLHRDSALVANSDPLNSVFCPTFFERTAGSARDVGATGRRKSNSVKLTHVFEASRVVGFKCHSAQLGGSQTVERRTVS